MALVRNTYGGRQGIFEGEGSNQHFLESSHSPKGLCIIPSMKSSALLLFPHNPPYPALLSLSPQPPPTRLVAERDHRHLQLLSVTFAQ